MSAAEGKCPVVLTLTDQEGAVAAVAVVDAMLEVQALNALVSGVEERMLEARVRGRGDRAWFAQMQDQLDEAQRRQSAAQRHAISSLFSWAGKYRPETRN